MHAVVMCESGIDDDEYKNDWTVEWFCLNSSQVFTVLKVFFEGMSSFL